MQTERIIEDVRALAFLDEPEAEGGGRRPQCISELEWRWQYADGDMQPSSNMAASIALIQSGGLSKSNRVSNDIDDRAYLAAIRASEVDSALAHLSDEQRALLMSLYASPSGCPQALLACIPEAKRLHADYLAQNLTSSDLVTWFRGISNESRIWSHPRANEIYQTILDAAVRAVLDAAKSYKRVRRISRSRSRK